MGGDGGSIPRRVDLVRTAGYKFLRNLGGMGYLPNIQVRTKDAKLSDTAERQLRWQYCNLTEERFVKGDSVAVAKNGSIIRLESLLEYADETNPAEAPDDEATPAGVAEAEASANASTAEGSANAIESASLGPTIPAKASSLGPIKILKEKWPLSCVLTGIDLATTKNAILLWSCGCTMSKAALAEVGGLKNGKCPHCSRRAGKLIPLVPKRCAVVRLFKRKAMPSKATNQPKIESPATGDPPISLQRQLGDTYDKRVTPYEALLDIKLKNTNVPTLPSVAESITKKTLEELKTRAPDILAQLKGHLS